MLTPEDRLETVGHNLNKAYSDIKRDLVVSKEFTEEAVKRLVSQKIILDEHSQNLSDHTAQLDRIETMLAQILTHLREMPSAPPPEPKHPDLAEPEPMQPSSVPQHRERTFWERGLGIFPEETEPEKPSQFPE